MPMESTNASAGLADSGAARDTLADPRTTDAQPSPIRRRMDGLNVDAILHSLPPDSVPVFAIGRLRSLGTVRLALERVVFVPMAALEKDDGREEKVSRDKQRPPALDLPDVHALVSAREVEQVFAAPDDDVTRSEEHTSELQSPCNLVCRLLLEKKNR